MNEQEIRKLFDDWWAANIARIISVMQEKEQGWLIFRAGWMACANQLQVFEFPLVEISEEDKKQIEEAWEKYTHALQRFSVVPKIADKVSDAGMKNEEGDWGLLENEPCRFCHKVKCVYFRIDDSPRGKNEPQVVRCKECGRDWEVTSSSA